MSDWPSPIPPSAFVSVRKYRAVGDGVTDDTSAIQRALDNELYVSFGAGPSLKSYLVGSQLVMRSGQILDFAGSTVTLPASSTNFTTGVFNLTGTYAGGPRSLASDGAEFASTITLTAGSVAALSLVAGNYLVIVNDDALYQHVEVKSVAGEVITLVDCLQWTFTTAKNSLVYRYTTASLKTAEIRNLYLDGSLNTGADSAGIYLLDTLRPRLENVTVIGFNYVGISVYQSQGLFLRDIRLRDCGNAAGADLLVNRTAHVSASGVYSENAPFFGPIFAWCSIGNLSDFRISGPGTRLFKLQTSAGFGLENFYLSTSTASVTGFGIVVGSRRNVARGIRVFGADEAIWCDGPFNQFWGVVCGGSLSRDLSFSVLATDCIVEGEFSTTGRIDNGARNRFIQTVG